MTRKGRTLLISLILLLTLGGVLAVMRLLPGDEGTSEATVDSVPVTLSDFDVADLRSVLIERPDGRLHFYSDDGAAWRIADVPLYFRPDEMAVTGTVRALTRLRSSDTILEKAAESDLNTFGFVPPEALLVFRDADGRGTTVEIGKESPTGSGRYARTAGSSTVVLLPSYYTDPAFRSPVDYRDMSLPTVNLDALDRLMIRRNGVTIKIEPGKTGDPFVTMSSPHLVTSPWRTAYPLDDYELRTILTEETPLPNHVAAFRDELDPDDPVLGLSPDDADLLAVTDTEGATLSLVIGAGDDAGHRYVRFGDREGPVFLMDGTDLGAIDISPFDVISKFVFLGSILEVSQVKVEHGDRTWFMNRLERGESEDTKDDRYDINGIETTQQNFSKVYQKFIGILWEGPADHGAIAPLPDVRITVTGNEPDAPRQTVRFWPYDEVYYLAAAGDDPLEFLVGRYQLTDFLEDLAALAGNTG